jgi:hypothetical protein
MSGLQIFNREGYYDPVVYEALTRVKVDKTKSANQRMLYDFLKQSEPERSMG